MPLQKKTTEFYNLLIGLINKTAGNITYDTLDMFAKRHGYTYDWVKKRVEALAYASGKENIAKTPRSMRQDIKNLREEMAKGNISPAQAREASGIVLSKTPMLDIDRLTRVYESKDPEVKEMQQGLVRLSGAVARTLVERGVHPARAKFVASSLIGSKIHHELPTVLEKVPKERLDKLIKELYRNNFLRAHGHLYYKLGDVNFLRAVKEAKRGVRQQYPYMPVDLGPYMRIRKGGIDLSEIDRAWKEGRKDPLIKALESEAKNIQRHPRPGVTRGVAKKTKEALKTFFEQKRGRIPEERAFGYHLASSGSSYSDADAKWAKAKEHEQKEISPFVQLRKKRRVKG